MKEAFDQVTEFHEAFMQDAPESPTLVHPTTHELRLTLIREELKEYIEAVQQNDLVAIADALADLAYVVIGTAVAHGLTNFHAIFAEVHRSNMSKLNANGHPLTRVDGKILKGPNYTPPDLTSFIR